MGNLLLRITGRNLRPRAYESGLQSVTEVFETVGADSDIKAQLLRLSTLRESVARNMDNLLIADALDEIVAVLGQVRFTKRHRLETVQLTSGHRRTSSLRP